MIDPYLIKSYMYQLSRGLQYMHSYDIWHRDIKPANLLVFPDGRIVIADFGLARFGVVGNGIYTQPIQTLWYRAPELLLGTKEYGAMIDVFSLGAVFAELILKTPIFHGQNERETLLVEISRLGHMTEESWPGISGMTGYTDSIDKFSKVRMLGKFDSIFDPYKDTIGEDGIQLMRQMMWPNPQKRIKMNDVLDSKYFVDVKNIIDKELEPPISNTYGDVPGDSDRILYSGDSDRILDLPPLITTSMLEIVYDWLYYIKAKYNLSNEALFIGRKITDLYLSLRSQYNNLKFDLRSNHDNLNLTEITRENLQLIGMTSLWIGAKIFEIYPPTVNDLVYISGKAYTTSEVLGAESSILRVLQFKLIFPLMTEYIYFYTEGLSPQTKTNAANLCLAANILGELVNTDEVSQICAYIALMCSKDPQPKCLATIDRSKADQLVTKLITLRKKRTKSKIWAKINPILDGWSDGDSNRDTGRLEIPELSDRKTSTPTRIDFNEFVESLEPDPTVTFHKEFKINVTRTESEDVSRNDLGDFIKEYMINTALKAANLFGFRQPRFLTDLFANYFKLSKTNDGVYRLGEAYRPPQRIAISLGPMTAETVAVVKFNQVPSSLEGLMDKYFDMVVGGEYDNGKLGAKIYIPVI